MLDITGTSAADTVAIVVSVKRLFGGVLVLDQEENCGIVVTGSKNTDDCVSTGVCCWNVGVTAGGGCWICAGGGWPPARPGG